MENDLNLNEEPSEEQPDETKTENIGDQPLVTLPLVPDKGEHVPPIIIKGGSFLIECKETFLPPTGVITPPFTYLSRFPFKIRGIRIIANPFGAPETLYYAPTADLYVLEIKLKRLVGTNFNLSLASVVIDGTSRLQLTTHDHALPNVLTSASAQDPRPHKYIYALDNSYEIAEVTVRNGTRQIIYQNAAQSEYRIGIWMSHEH